MVPIRHAGTTVLTTVYTCPDDGSVAYAMFRGLRAASETAGDDATADCTVGGHYIGKDLPVPREAPFAMVSRDDDIDIAPGETVQLRVSEVGIDFVGSIEEVAP